MLKQRSLIPYIIAFGCICCLIGCNTTRMGVTRHFGLSTQKQCDATGQRDCKQCKKGPKHCSPKDDCRCHEPASKYSLCWDDFNTGMWAAKRADKNLKPCDKGENKVSCDFKAGYKQGYTDVAKGYSGKTPAVSPPKYWKHYYRSEAGKWRPEQWFEGYASGVESAYAEGLGQSRYIAASQVSFQSGVTPNHNRRLVPSYSQVVNENEAFMPMPNHVPADETNWTPPSTIPQNGGHTW